MFFDLFLRFLNDKRHAFREFVFLEYFDFYLGNNFHRKEAERNLLRHPPTCGRRFACKQSSALYIMQCINPIGVPYGACDDFR